MNRDAQSNIFDAPYSLNQIRKRHIEAVLDMVNWDLGAAAKLLGLNVAVLRNWMRELHISESALVQNLDEQGAMESAGGQLL